MASSSVSQEDVDNDFELSSRRTRIRTARACRNANPPPPTAAITSSSSITAIPSSALTSRINGWSQSYLYNHHALGCGADHREDGNVDGAGNLGTCLPGGELRAAEGGPGGDHNDASPKPLGRAKEKRVNRANHLNKGKQQRDRRKLREKRRSTGVVHLPSTESTGGSTGEDEDEGAVLQQCPLAAETRRNTHHNEHLLLDRTGPADGSTPSENNAADNEERVPIKGFTARRNKSPSDLEADDEDNQEFDSLNQSDSATGSAPHPPTPTASVAPLPPLLHQHHHHHHHHHHHRHQSGSSHSTHAASTNSSSVTQERVPNGNRPGTPTGENMEELLERAQEENRRLLRLLEERDRRIATLEAKVNTLREEKEQILRQTAPTGKANDEETTQVEATQPETAPTEEGEGISKV